jgi:protein TonB
MLPEAILQSDLLDILFENRNKAYGAYAIRKQYRARLAKAIISIAALALLLALPLLFYKGDGSKKQVADYVGETITLTAVPLAMDQPKKQQTIPPRPPAKQAQQVKFIDNIDIVKTEVTGTIPTIKALEDSEAGDKNATGDAALTGKMQSGNVPSSLPAIKKEELKAEEPIYFAETMPQYPGGNDAFQKFMQRNLKQPDDLGAGERIVVTVRFIVEKDGSIVGVELMDSGRSDLDETVLKAVRKMPKWVPGVQNGRKVPVYFKLPVTFVGQEQ